MANKLTRIELLNLGIWLEFDNSKFTAENQRRLHACVTGFVYGLITDVPIEAKPKDLPPLVCLTVEGKVNSNL